jgi:dephospho-CoA kinase
MLIIGLTGSMGMGKSTAAARFRALGIGVFDSDAAVHALYAGPAAAAVEAAFPGTTRDGQVDRARLAEAVVHDASALKRLEAIVHPMVRQEQRAFLDREAARGAKMAVLEIPLLYETGGDDLVDTVVAVSASPEAQRERVLAREGMTPEKLEGLLARQTPDAEKRRRADFVVDTNGPIAQTYEQIDTIIGVFRTRRGEAYQRVWLASEA